jgi:Kef-type K+ transport system membrane component KefB
MQDTLAHVLIALAAVILLGRVLGAAFKWLGQPPVIGEVTAGILLGPSLLGKEVSGWILPESVGPYLAVVAQLGVILYMFLVGLELNGEMLRRRARSTLAISNASIVAPFVLGALLAMSASGALKAPEVAPLHFVLFVGVAMSITAFPVLARILADLKWQQTELGVIALGAAAIGDATAWCLLALIVGVMQSDAGSAVTVCLSALAFIAAMLLVVRPWAGRVADRIAGEGLNAGGLALVLVAVLVAALATEWIGIHAIFGAFLLGAVIPHDSRLAHEATEKLHDAVTTLLLPAFFALTGMRTEIGLVSGWQDWLWCAAIIVVATVGKFGGAMFAARCCGIDWRKSAAIGALMNTRGLMELIVLNVGLDLGVISPRLFAMMVLMAIATTLMTTPALRMVSGEGCR